LVVDGAHPGEKQPACQRNTGVITSGYESSFADGGRPIAYRRSRFQLVTTRFKAAMAQNRARVVAARSVLVSRASTRTPWTGS